MKSKKEFEVIFHDLSLKYDLQYLEIKDIFIDVLKEIFNYEDILELEKEETKDYGFFIYKNSTFKKISFSPRIRTSLKNLLPKKIQQYKNRLLKARVLGEFKNVIPGEVVKINETNVMVKTSFFVCLAPKPLLAPHEVKNLKIGQKLFFKIKKFNFKKEVPVIILTTLHQDIELHYIKNVLLPKYDIKRIKRVSQDKMKIYLDRLPRKDEVSMIKSFFNLKIVQFLGFKRKDKKKEVA